ncbi:hypothetical protein Tco_0567977 [Tanacetum coccineum]
MMLYYYHVLVPYVVTLRVSALAGCYRIRQGLEVAVVHGKTNKNLKDIESYNIEVEAKYLAVVKDLEDLTIPAYYARDGPHTNNPWGRDIPLFKSIAAYRAKAAEKRKRNASLDVVAEAGDASQPSSLDSTTKMPEVETMAATSVLHVSSAALEAGIIVHAQVVDQAKSTPKIATDGSALIVSVSQEPPIAITDYQISDLNVDGDVVHNDDDLF